MRALLFLVGLTAAHASDQILLQSIAQVENHKWSDPGGRYAIRYAVWSDRTTLPYALASQERFATPVAISHLTWLRAALKRKGISPTAYNLAGCWRSGLARWTSGKAPEAHRDYARRVVNLYEEELASAPATAPVIASAPAISAPFPLILSAPIP